MNKNERNFKEPILTDRSITNKSIDQYNNQKLTSELSNAYLEYSRENSTSTPIKSSKSQIQNYNNLLKNLNSNQTDDGISDYNKNSSDININYTNDNFNDN